MSADPTRPLPEWSQAQQWSQRPAEPPTFVTRRRRRKGPLIALITVIVLLVLLVVSDRVANAYAENQMASQVQSSLALSGKPHVTIQGFPFWTQLIAKDFKTVDITASNETINYAQRGRRGAGDRQPERHAARSALPRVQQQQRDRRPVQRLGAGHVYRAGERGRHPAGHHAELGRREHGQGRRSASARSAPRPRRRLPRPGRTRSTSRSPTPPGSRWTSWGTWPTSTSRSPSCRRGCRSRASV